MFLMKPSREKILGAMKDMEIPAFIRNAVSDLAETCESYERQLEQKDGVIAGRCRELGAIESAC